MNAQLAADIHAKLIIECVTPRAHDDPEIGAGLVAEQVFAGGFHLAAGIAEQQVAALGEGGDETGLIHAFVFLGGQQHAGVARVQGEREHLAADGGNDAGVVNGPEIGKQLLGVGQGNFIRLFEPAEGAQIIHARRFQSQHHFREVQPADFRHLVRGTFIVFGARPEAHAFAGGGTAGATGPLVGVRLRNFINEQGVDTAIGIVTRHAGEAGINHEAHAINGDARFGHVGGDDDLALFVAGHGGVLVLGLQFAVQGQDDEAFGFRSVADGFDGL